jgi:hypothetical protein
MTRARRARQTVYGLRLTDCADGRQAARAGGLTERRGGLGQTKVRREAASCQAVGHIRLTLPGFGGRGQTRKDAPIRRPAAASMRRTQKEKQRFVPSRAATELTTRRGRPRSQGRGQRSRTQCRKTEISVTSVGG